MKMTPIASLVTSLLVTSSVFAISNPATSHSAPVTPAVFNTNNFPSDLTGSLDATVLFAQNQIMPSKNGVVGDEQPHLTAQRATLLMVKPKEINLNTNTPLRVTATSESGQVLGSLDLNRPENLPKTAYYMEGAPEGGINFTPESGSSVVIKSSAQLAQLNDKDAVFLLDKFKTNSLVEINTADGVWVRDIYLPNNPSLENKVFRAKSRAGYNSSIKYSGREATLSNGKTLNFKFVNGQWFREGELDNNNLTYAENMWSTKLPAQWVKPGLKLAFTYGDLSGQLNELRIGAPSELLMHTIDLGMLTEPRNAFRFANDPKAQREYFQTIPASRMVVNQYESLYLPEVMLPNGTLLTDFDPSTGGWHSGTMRQRIGKELISIGIDNANYGINSSVGEGESGHPYIASQLAAHNSRGKYENGVQTHGGSGGGGIVTLDDSLGNEFSHEVGHNYELGHYPGGFKGSVHRAANEVNSTWGWDADLNRFIPNLSGNKSNQDSCLDGQCQAPFDGRRFGFDSMAGGSPLSSLNRFTLYTPYSMVRIQNYFEKKVVFSADSATGFKKWDPVTRKMEPYQHRISVAEQITASNNNLSEAYFTTLFADYAIVRVSMADGNWAKFINVPVASASNKGRALTINHAAGYNSYLVINGESVLISRGTKKEFVSDGIRWNETAAPDLMADRRPTAFGVPVTTLVGYYDPKGVLPTYIYPALHGAYGFTYPDDNQTISSSDCQLRVETATGQSLNYKLGNVRVNANTMNKFHINVAESVNPASATIICDDKTLDSKAIQPPKGKLTYTVNGMPLGNGDAGNQPPVANAGDDIRVSGPTDVILNGTGSHDPENKTLTYQWKQISGNSVNIEQADQAKATIKLDAAPTEQTLQFELTVKDDQGLLAIDTVQVTNLPSVVNNPPVVTLPDSITVKAGKQTVITVQANDPEGDALSYQWTVPTGLQATGQNTETLTITAPAVSQTTTYSVSVSVSDNHQIVERSVNIIVEASTGDSCTVTDPDAANWDAWSETSVYVAGNKVSHNDLVWSAKYWTKGNTPSIDSAEWALESKVEMSWSAKATYQGGETTSHNGRRWKAKWWTQGDQPGINGVWEDIGVSSCN
ncbi:MAG: M66 family metalloprotease [Plesiomonas sp.]